MRIADIRLRPLIVDCWIAEFLPIALLPDADEEGEAHEGLCEIFVGFATRQSAIDNHRPQSDVRNPQSIIADYGHFGEYARDAGKSPASPHCTVNWPCTNH